MRLARYQPPPKGTSLVVSEAPPPAWGMSAEDQQSFLETHRRLYAPAIDHAERFLGADDADDAVGDAMLALWNRWATLSQEKRSDKYVLGVVHYCVTAKLKANRKRRHISLEDAEPELDRRAISAMLDGDGRDLIEILDAAVAALPAKRREVLLFVREQDFTYQEAAEALGLSFGTIKTHLRLAYKDIRATFRRAGFRVAELPDTQPPALKTLLSPKGGDTND